MLLILSLSGCFAGNWLVFVRQDGSGTITMDFSMDKSVVEMMQGFGGEDSAPPTSADLIDEEEMTELAESMGPGVRFISVEPRSGSDDSIGYSALFEFDNIESISIDPMAGAPSDETESNSSDAVRFSFDSGSVPRLTIRIDQTKESEESEATEEQDSEETAMMASMMKPFLEGMAFSVVVEVEGTIRSTNASFVDGNRVTIMDFDMGKILNNEELFSRVINADSVADKAFQNEFADAGIRIETREEVHIEFR